MSSNRVAISMRVTTAPTYHELRDALSQDWHRYLVKQGLDPILVPNQPDRVQGLLDDLDVTGVILSSGNNVSPERYGGTEAVDDAWPERDRTETGMVEWAMHRGVPVLGVCRGMHMINVHYGGRLLPRLAEQVPGVLPHVNRDHEVEIIDKALGAQLEIQHMTTNSFHNQGFTRQEMADGLTCFAVTAADGVVEGVVHRALPVVGIQWHPERPGSSTTFDERLFAFLFKGQDWRRYWSRGAT